MREKLIVWNDMWWKNMAKTVDTTIAKALKLKLPK